MINRSIDDENGFDFAKDIYCSIDKEWHHAVSSLHKHDQTSAQTANECQYDEHVT